MPSIFNLLFFLIQSDNNHLKTLFKFFFYPKIDLPEGTKKKAFDFLYRTFLLHFVQEMVSLNFKGTFFY